MFEDFAVFVFIIEYLLRLWIHDSPRKIIIEHYERASFLDIPFRLSPAFAEVLRSKWRYLSSPMAIIDLLAILPSYRPMRLLRLFLLFRLFKLFRYARSAGSMANMLTEKRFEFYTLLIFMGFVLLTSSTAIYLFEANVPDTRFKDYFDAIYWSMITLSTVGYGDITPLTAEGRVVAMALIFSGLGVMAFTTSIVVSAFQDKLPDMRERRVLSELDRMRDYTVICGYGRVGQVVVDKLIRERERFVIIERDADKTHAALSKGYLAIQGDAAEDELLRHVGVADRVSTVLCITSDDVTNILVTISARQMNDKLTIISRANRKAVVQKLKLAGADHVVAPFEIVGLMGSEFVGKPVASEALYGLLSGEQDVILDTVLVPPDSQICGQTLAEINLSGSRLLLFGIIMSRHEQALPGSELYPMDDRHFYFNPPRSFRVEAHDMLVLVGHQFSLQHFRRTLETRRHLMGRKNRHA